MKTILERMLCASLSVLLIFSACTTTKTGSDDLPSASLEDYITVEETFGRIRYRLADYSPMEKWFAAQASGMNDADIPALYDKLPLIGEMDSFDGFPPEKKAKYILEIAKPIINKDPGYEQTSKAFSDYAEEALRETFAFYAQLFPKLEADILLVINPFFMNGGMGDVQTLPEGQRAGRLEIGTSVISNNPVTGRHGVQVWIAHEMTHVVHLLLGAKDALDDLDSPEAMKGLSKYYFGLYTEGLATYTSSLIAKLNHDENLELLYFSDAYSSGPIYEKGFVPSLAKKFLDTVEDKDPVDKEFHGQWFGSKTPPEERPVPQYPFLGYFLGAHGIKTLIDEGTPLEDLFKQSLYDMLKDMKRAVNILAKV